MIMQLLQIAYKGYRIRAKKGLKGGGDFGLFKEKFLLFFLSVVRGDAEAALFHMVRNSLSMHVYQHGYHIYDYLQNVPIVFVKKGLFPENKRIDADLRHIDLLPTLIEALHLDAPPEGYDGTSYFSYILEGGGQDRPTYMEARGATAYAEKVFLIRGVRRENRKIAFAPYEKDAPVEYYDLSMDSQELNNLGSTEEAAKLKKEADTIATSFSQHAGQRLTVAENLELIERLKDLGYM
jgi:arylsulfatase A-like enzyme